jgi:uncharacterized protein YdeI (YjbR/CyaY-like superfamily)
MKNQKALPLTNRNEWRKWLAKNHDRENEIWLVFYKRHTGKPCLPYPEALEEALCFGWIDGKLKRIDDEKHAIRFCPRRPKSVWSKNNRQTAQRLIREGRMTPAGRGKIAEAKKNGNWSAAYRSREKVPLPEDLKKSLQADKQAWRNFNNFANSYQTMYIWWISAAKRPQARTKRIERVVARSARNTKPGIDL